MKNITMMILIISATWAGDIHVHITGIHQPPGDLYIGLYKQAKGFLHTERAYKKIKRKGRQSLHCRFRHIPKGTYAIAIFHDANSNGKLDKNFLGIPKEQTGTSNNVVSYMGPPRFEKAKFNHSKETKLTIRMR